MKQELKRKRQNKIRVKKSFFGSKTVNTYIIHTFINVVINK